MYDIGTFKLLKTMTHLCGSIYNIVVSGHLLIAATYENSINVFDLRTFECIRSLPGHNGAVYSLTIANNKLYSGSYDNTIRVWDLSTFNCVQKCVGHAGSVEALEATSDGLVYSGSTDGLIKVRFLFPRFPASCCRLFQCTRRFGNK
jgi:WD40 repeat protein